jgi:P22 tail accessory factor
MGWTKRQFVVQAYEEIGYASYAYDLQPEQLQAGLRRLEAMIATWNGRGVRLGYPLSSNPDNANLDDVTQVPDAANEAIASNLACKIAPIVGKAVSPETKQAARSSYMQLLSRFTKPNEMQLPNTMPSGAGNKPWRQDTPFLPVPDDPIDAGDDGQLNFY